MIRRRKFLGKVSQYYLYVGGLYAGWYTCKQLSMLPQCIISKKRLTKRLHKIVTGGETNDFKTVLDCMSRPVNKNKSKQSKKKKPGIPAKQDYIIEEHMWPAGSLSHTVR